MLFLWFFQRVSLLINKRLGLLSVVSLKRKTGAVI